MLGIWRYAPKSRQLVVRKPRMARLSSTKGLLKLALATLTAREIVKDGKTERLKFTWEATMNATKPLAVVG
ncbi:MAG: hypothetical protein Kow00121_34850 [Elainellaceae cyanobacterium]